MSRATMANAGHGSSRDYGTLCYLLVGALSGCPSSMGRVQHRSSEAHHLWTFRCAPPDVECKVAMRGTGPQIPPGGTPAQVSARRRQGWRKRSTLTHLRQGAVG